MSLDLTKPVQVVFRNEWRDAVFVRKLNRRDDCEPRYVAIFVLHDGDEWFDEVPETHLRNTPAPEKRTPLTAETWPAWAVRIRLRRHDKPDGTWRAIAAVLPTGVEMSSNGGWVLSFESLSEDYRLGDTLGNWFDATVEGVAKRKVTP
jgi:hypothetical protein